MSSVISKLKTISEKVTHYLKIKNEYKDNDEKLVATAWFNELKDMGFDPTQMSAFSFLKLYAENRLTSADIITRARRLVQAENKELRGEAWYKRHKEEKEVREQINDL